MAVNRVPVLKRCRSLGLDPIYLWRVRKAFQKLLSESTEETWYDR